MLRDGQAGQTYVKCAHLPTKQAFACNLQIYPTLNVETLFKIQMFSSLRNFHPLRVAASAGLKGALPKVLVGAALAFGGTTVLSAGSAEAIGMSCGTSGPYTQTDKTITGFGCTGEAASFDLIDFSLLANGIEWEFIGIETVGSTVGSFFYNIALNSTAPPGTTFSQVELDTICADIASGTCNVEKLIYDEAGGTLLATLRSEAGEEDFYDATGRTSLYIVDRWGPATTPALVPPALVTGVANIYTQTSSVPGPLPLLGAGMAFGFSRKLRSRIKARVQA
jgi:hypothetical protein